MAENKLESTGVCYNYYLSNPADTSERKNIKMNIRTDLTPIPGIGKKMAEHLISVGYPTIESLKGQDPEEIYMKHCLLQGVGNMSCRCVLYCYRLAVHFADHDGQLPSDKQNWGDWKD